MIKKLQKKFILIATIVITTVVLAIVGGINIANYVKVNNETDKIINIIEGNNGNMPKPQENEGGDRMAPEGEMPKDFEKNDLSLETPFRTRYFTVLVSANETFVDLSNIYSISKTDALSFVDKVKNSNKSSGFIGNYKYLISKDDMGGRYIFVDCEQEISMFKDTLIVSSVVGVSAIAIILILIIVFSKMAVKPIAESYEKQKRFITDANHEIKTPLTIIGATNEILEMQYGENEWTETIQNQVKRLTELTEKLVLLSKVEEDNATFPMENVALSSVIKECALEFKALAEAQNKSYTIDVAPNIEGKASSTLIKRLVSILLDNAFKYTNENGSIAIAFSMVGKRKRLTVKNTAGEIPKGDLERLFERFYRLDSSRNSKTGGSGIGLSAAKAIANIHGGKITAKSDDGKSLQIDFVF